MRARLALSMLAALGGMSFPLFERPAPRRVTVGGARRRERPRKGSNHARRLERRRVHAARMATMRAQRR